MNKIYIHSVAGAGDDYYSSLAKCKKMCNLTKEQYKELKSEEIVFLDEEGNISVYSEYINVQEQ